MLLSEKAVDLLEGIGREVKGDEKSLLPILTRTLDWERACPPALIDPRQLDYAAEDAVLAQMAPAPKATVAGATTAISESTSR